MLWAFIGIKLKKYFSQEETNIIMVVLLFFFGSLMIIQAFRLRLREEVSIDFNFLSALGEKEVLREILGRGKDLLDRAKRGMYRPKVLIEL